MFFQNLMSVIVLFFFGVLILTPVYIRLTKDSLFDEFKKMWQSEVEAKKRELAMQENNLNRATFKEKKQK